MGSVLVFLPGREEIECLYKLLTEAEFNPKLGKLEVAVLYSGLWFHLDPQQAIVLVVKAILPLISCLAVHFCVNLRFFLCVFVFLFLFHLL